MSWENFFVAPVGLLMVQYMHRLLIVSIKLSINGLMTMMRILVIPIELIFVLRMTVLLFVVM